MEIDTALSLDPIDTSTFDRAQLTKLLIHTLKELGYNRSSTVLQEESGGLQIESNVVQRVFNLLKEGKYDEITLDLLLSLSLRSGHYHPRVSDETNVFASGKHIDEATTKSLASNSADGRIQAIIDNFQLQLRNFQGFLTSLAELNGNSNNSNSNSSNNNLVTGEISIVFFRSVLEIMILINKNFFLELVLFEKDPTRAVTFLRNVLRQYLMLWEAVSSNLHELGDDTDIDIPNELESSGSELNKIPSRASSMDFAPERVLRELSALLTNPNPEYRAHAVSVEELRQRLVERIANYINPDDLIPRGRLFTLLKQAIKYQRLQDPLNLFDEMGNGTRGSMLGNSSETGDSNPRKINLLQDNISNFTRINFLEYKKLSQNDDEIWYLQFSPDGKYLASASANAATDKKILIYDVENDFKLYKILGGNNQSVLHLSFSPDSQFLVSCPFNENTNIYNIHQHGEPFNLLSEDKHGVTRGNNSSGSSSEDMDDDDDDDIIDINMDVDGNATERTRTKQRKRARSRLELDTTAELIQPINSFQIPSYVVEVSGTNHVSTGTNESGGTNATESHMDSDSSTASSSSHSPSPSPSSASSPSSGSTSSSVEVQSSTTSPTGAHGGITNRNLSSIRIWCCDWFHTPINRGKLILGSPDRDVVIYDTQTRSIIYRFSKNFSASGVAGTAATGQTTSRGNFSTRSEFELLGAGGSTGIGGIGTSSGTGGSEASTGRTTTSNEQLARIHDLKISYDDNYLILMTHQGTIEVYDISPLSRDILANPESLVFRRVSKLNVDKNMTCISLPLPSATDSARDSGMLQSLGETKFNSLVLVNLQYNEMQLWDYKENVLIQKYFGQKQEQFIIRSCFGFDNKLVVSGSEDGKIYIWDRLKGNIITVLDAHTNERAPSFGQSWNRRVGRNCNIVAWNPKNKYIFASGGDDGYVVIWKIVKSQGQ